MKPTNLYDDNFGIIQCATIQDGKLKKKHEAISYHYVHEAITAVCTELEIGRHKLVSDNLNGLV
jgi:hypothetical protein